MGIREKQMEKVQGRRKNVNGNNGKTKWKKFKAEGKTLIGIKEKPKGKSSKQKEKRNGKSSKQKEKR